MMMEGLELLDNSLKAADTTSSAGPPPITDLEAQMASEAARLMAENKVQTF